MLLLRSVGQVPRVVRRSPIFGARRSVDFKYRPSIPAYRFSAAADEREDSNKDPNKLDSRVWPIAASNLLMGSAIGVMLPVMPLFAKELGISTAELGAAVSAIGIARLLSNIPAAWLVDKYGRRPLMIFGPFISALGMTATAVCTTASELIATRFVTGVGGSLNQAGSQSYLADISTIKNRARTMAPMGAAFSAGALCGPAIGGFIGGNYGLHMPFYFVGGAIFGVTALNFIMLPETRPISNDHLGEDKRLVDEFSETIKLWKPLLADTNIRGILGVYTSYWILSVGCMFTLMPLLAVERFGATPSVVGSVYAVNSLINIIGSQPAAWISDKKGRKAVIAPGIFIAGSGTAFMAAAQSLDQFLAACVVYGVGSSLIGSAPMAYVSDVTDDRTRTQALALMRSGGDVGFVFGGGLCGSISLLLGTNAAYASCIGIFFASGMYFLSRSIDPVKNRAS